MRIKWGEVSRNTGSIVSFKLWEKLKKYFGQDDVDHIDLIEFYIYYNLPVHPTQDTIISQIFKGTHTRLPIQRGTIVKNLIDHELIDVIRSLKKLSPTHSVYAFMCSSLYYNKKDLRKISVIDYPYAFYDAPEWLQIILWRQYLLTLNARRKTKDDFFFVKDRIGLPPEDINLVEYAIEEELGMPWKEYKYYFNKMEGIKSFGGLMFSFRDVTAHIYRDARTKVLHKYVSVHAYDENKESFLYDHGACLSEIEDGVFLVHTTDGVYVVPYHLLDYPHIYVSYPPEENLRELLLLGYTPEDEWPSIDGMTKLSGYKIRRFQQLCYN